MAAATAKSAPTQAFVPVKEIRNGIIVLKDGGYRGILMCSSVNFGLKSADEQRAITEGFQNFLNTLDFSVQIVINSRKMDLRPYLTLLEGKAAGQKKEREIERERRIEESNGREREREKTIRRRTWTY